MFDDKLVKLLCITAILQRCLYLFTAEFTALVSVETVYQFGKEGRRCIRVQITVRARARAIDLFKTDLQPVMLTQ
ncbi:hypothetical protein D3C75_905120 [compost metagenome]